MAGRKAAENTSYDQSYFDCDPSSRRAAPCRAAPRRAAPVTINVLAPSALKSRQPANQRCTHVLPIHRDCSVHKHARTYTHIGGPPWVFSLLTRHWDDFRRRVRIYSRGKAPLSKRRFAKRPSRVVSRSLSLSLPLPPPTRSLSLSLSLSLSRDYQKSSPTPKLYFYVATLFFLLLTKIARIVASFHNELSFCKEKRVERPRKVADPRFLCGRNRTWGRHGVKMRRSCFYENSQTLSFFFTRFYIGQSIFDRDFHKDGGFSW